MPAVKIVRYTRTFSEVRNLMLERARAGRNPCDFTPYDEVERILSTLSSVDRDAWAEAFSAAAQPYEEEARRAEEKGDTARARESYLRAYGCYRVARYPTLNSPAKRAAYRRSQDAYVKAGRYLDPPIERVEIPFHGRPRDGTILVGLLRRPRRQGTLPVIVTWGGIDSFKEERRTDAFVARGFVTLAIDMPGVGDAPIVGALDAERMWDAVFDWIAGRPGLDARRVALWGASTGGYWATKLAHTHRHRVAAAVNHGGCAHYAFTPEWIEKAQYGEYPFELAETLASAFGLSSFEEWVDYAPRLSLLTQGVLERPCAPLLCVNGLNDSVFPIADHYLLLEHGEPKAARFFPAGHMGNTPETMPVIVDWVARTVG